MEVFASKVKMHFKEDLHYIEETLSGNLNAFGRLIQKHEKYAYTLSYRILRNHEEAEEATQDAFMKVYSALKTFERKSKFTTWLYKIVYHESLGRLRKSKKDIIELDLILETEEAPTEFVNGLNLLQEFL